MKDQNFHMYKCSGCGHTTIIDKYYKIRVNFCGVCGEKDHLSYQSPCTVKEHRTGFRIFENAKET